MAIGRDAGSGYVHELIVKAILGGAKSNAQIATQLKAYISGDGLVRVLKKMEHRRWLGRNQRGYFVTDAGRRCLPGYVLNPPPWMRTFYQPPPPSYRRPDSDPAVYPSIAAGQLREYQAHV